MTLRARSTLSLLASVLAAAAVACGPRDDREPDLDAEGGAAATAPVASSAPAASSPVGTIASVPAAPTPPPAVAPTPTGATSPPVPVTPPVIATLPPSGPAMPPPVIAPPVTTPPVVTSPPVTNPPVATTPPVTPPPVTTPPSVRPIVKPRLVWDPSPNQSSRRGRKIDAIVIHTTEGAYAGAVRWLKTPAARASAHYVIKEDGSEIRQLVADDRAAWAQTYYNDRGIGIECAGFAGKASTWTPGLTRALRDLVAWLAKTHGVKVVHPTSNAYSFGADRFDAPGLVGHGQIQPWNRSDPGPHFDWAGLVSEVDARIKADRSP